MTDTTQYEVFQSNFDKICSGVAGALSVVAARAFSKKLIGENSVEKAELQGSTASNRSSELVRILLNRIEGNKDDFYTILEIFEGIPSLCDVCKRLSSIADGPDTPRYRVVNGHFYPLVNNFEQHLDQLAELFHQANLISEHDKQQASSPREPAFGRSVALLTTILKKIEREQENYEDFALAMHQIPELKGIASQLDSTLEKEGGCLNFSHSHPSKVGAIVTQRKPGYSDSQLKVKPVSKDLDSGVADNLHSSHVGLDSEEPDDGSDDVSGNLHAAKDSASLVHGIIKSNIQPSTLPSSSRDCFDENNHLRLDKKEQASQILHLNEAIEQLNEEIKNCAEKLRQQEVKIKQKEEEVKSLRKDCDEKDKRVEGLTKDKAEMEKMVYQLKEAEEKNKEEIRSIHEAYRAKLEQLEKNLNDVESKEKTAQLELANAKEQLAKAQLEKEREISRWKDESVKQQKIIIELQKTQQLKDKEMAELKISHAKEAESRAKEETKQANMERRKSELKAEELAKELEKWKSEQNTCVLL